MRAGVLLLAVAAASSWSFLDLWLTPDQQGRFLFERGGWSDASEQFVDFKWKGASCYRAGDWPCAIDSFARLSTAEGSYNLGNSYASNGDLELAIEAYEQALQLRPDWPEALANHDLVASLISAEPAAPEDEQGPPVDPTFDPDEIRFDEKGDQGKEGELQQDLFSEEQIAEMWLRGVQSTPADFLRLKFAAQAAARESQ